ncbi:hypothetical protein P691DRAFT_756135 [Macrolepiota fuliginosa MF-IS2]|uniref:Alpha-ketoglutarate-dependent dioxygenase AlkB-like domain-containing protein n=1 Tax=Macrolepiota fuliginosa MF-IS2 TaxID=1400762 RepID=A0A9P5XNE7_9AGAR|nr:hypothetical protein P691DRAFT_756135 [Macrolepiota fuliginosa MF-IS2]
MAPQLLHIKQLKSWDDPTLLTQAPFQDTFASWMIQYQGGSATRAYRALLMKEFLRELKISGIQSILQHWVDLAFNSYQGSQTKGNLVADQSMLQFFVEIQWALFKKEDATLLLTKECHRRGVEYMPPIAVQPGLGLPPKLPTSAKRKARVGQSEEYHKKAKLNPSVALSSVASRAQRPATIPPKRPRAVSKDGSKLLARAQSLTSTKSSACMKTGVTKELLKLKEQRNKYLEKIKEKRIGIKPRRAEKAALGAALHKNKRSKVKDRRKPRDLVQPSKPVEELAPALAVPASGGLPLVNENSQAVHAPNNRTLDADTPPKTASIPITPNAGAPSIPIQYPTSLSLVEDQKRLDLKSLPSPLLSTGEPHSESISNWLKDPEDSGIPNIQDQPDLSQVLKTETSQSVIPAANLPLAVKPPLPGYPPIWAQSRQEVCESFDWFRSYQGGVYHARNVARGYLLSAFSARRDVFRHGGRLIISHGGGKAQSVHTRQGQHITQEADDQLAQDKSVRSLLENYRSRRPIVLLIDDKYILFPYDLGVMDITYAVLGFYTIVHAWAEYQPAGNERGRVVRYKFAFQWCESQGDPWWLKFNASNVPGSPDPGRSPPNTSEDEPECVEQSFAPFAHIEQISTQCYMCGESSPQVYERAWTCLNPKCRRFWLDMNGKSLGDELQYNPQFLQLAPADALAVPAEKLEPGLPLITSQGLTTDYAYTRGWHCKSCGRLSCRYKWEHWECMHCKAVLNVESRIHRATEFLFLTPPVSFKEVFIAQDSGIERLALKIFSIRLYDGSSGQCHTYKLPHGRGFIHHIKAGNPHWNWEADEIFQEYQAQASTGALPFRRWPMRAHKCRGALLTNYFSQNAGVPYQYVGGTENTLSFDQVPGAVVRARDLIQTRVKQALERDETFNEVLSAAYMERQRMAFHTDDEVGLGPLVAGLSLGSPALMHFRVLARHTPEGAPRSIAISFVLRHGDVLAMDGAGVQQYYEHTVVPTNFRIAATARCINITHPKRENSN